MEIEHEYTGCPVCPKCGTQYDDAWEDQELQNDEDTSLYNCDECGCDFEVTMNITVDYCTKLIKEK